MPTWRTVLMAGALWCGCASGAAREPWADADDQESPPAENAEVPKAEDQSPRRIRATQATYPPEALKACIEGDVVLRIVIDESGQVAEAEVVKSVPGLDDAALQCVKEWRYEPPRRNGQPARAGATVSLSFRLYEQGDHAACAAARAAGASKDTVPGEGPRVSVDVGMDFAGTQVRFNVRVANRSPTGDIVAVVIGRDRPLLERPFGIGKPKGWESLFVKRESPGNPARWVVWLSCDPGVLARVAEGLESGANLGGEHCGANAILPGDKRAFSLTVLSRRSVGLGPGSVAVLFSGGQTQVGGP